MFLHIGATWMLPSENIVGMFDFDNTTQAKATQSLLKDAQKRGKIKNVDENEIPKSYILTKNGNVYLSPMSTKTLTKRAMEGFSAPEIGGLVDCKAMHNA